MTISVRLDDHLEAGLEKAARSAGISKSDLIRKCLEEYLTRQTLDRLPWQLGKELFGKVGSGRSDLSVNRKQILRKKIHAKQSARRLRAARRPV